MEWWEYTQEDRQRQAINIIKRWEKVNGKYAQGILIKQAYLDSRSPAKRKVYYQWLVDHNMVYLLPIKK